VKISGFNNAVILLDKPAGQTSFDTISQLRRLSGIRKVGHSGTLDKFASGLLVICTGGATKLTRYFLESDKRYTGIIKLGLETDTCDITGEVLSEKSVSGVTADMIKGAVSGFAGWMKQMPPVYSSLKVGGKRASDRVRAGEEVILEERDIRIDRFDITGINGDTGEVEFDILCSKGTYIRSIARDLGEKLGTGGCLKALRRVQSGPFSIDRAADMDAVKKFVDGTGDGSFILEPAEALEGFGTMTVNEKAAAKIMNGALFSRLDVVLHENRGLKPYMIEDEEKNLIAIAEIDIENWQITYHSVFKN
ncbi:MAG TPA: tRNA pseudouridine(55) synthase TruB, partial [Spirochaetota bacterium]|nr:tRNA pseudouridine(55) synthase TruB [Spirochaetota bacterium]